MEALDIWYSRMLLLLTELFLCPLQCLARPHLIDVLGRSGRIHYNGHTVVGHLDNAKSDYCPVPVCFPLECET